MRGYTQDKDAYLRRLRRIEGQVRGLQLMVENYTYCIDILTQVSAVTRALQAVALGLVEDHLGHCVTQAIEDGGPEAADKVKEDEAPVEEMGEDFSQYSDPKYAEQLMSESMPDEDLPSMSLPRKGPASEQAPEEVGSRTE